MYKDIDLIKDYIAITYNNNKIIISNTLKNNEQSYGFDFDNILIKYNDIFLEEISDYFLKEDFIGLNFKYNYINDYIKNNCLYNYYLNKLSNYLNDQKILNKNFYLLSETEIINNHNNYDRSTILFLNKLLRKDYIAYNNFIAKKDTFKDNKEEIKEFVDLILITSQSNFNNVNNKKIIKLAPEFKKVFDGIKSFEEFKEENFLFKNKFELLEYRKKRFLKIEHIFKEAIIEYFEQLYKNLEKDFNILNTKINTIIKNKINF